MSYIPYYLSVWLSRNITSLPILVLLYLSWTWQRFVLGGDQNTSNMQILCSEWSVIYINLPQSCCIRVINRASQVVFLIELPMLFKLCPNYLHYKHQSQIPTCNAISAPSRLAWHDQTERLLEEAFYIHMSSPLELRAAGQRPWSVVRNTGSRNNSQTTNAAYVTWKWVYNSLPVTGGNHQ